MNKLLIKAGIKLSEAITVLTVAMHHTTMAVLRANSRLLDYLKKRADDL